MVIKKGTESGLKHRAERVLDLEPLLQSVSPTIIRMLLLGPRVHRSLQTRHISDDK